MAKYNTFIELSPHYESVVDIDSESRHPDMWQEYIVHEDMKIYARSSTERQGRTAP